MREERFEITVDASPEQVWQMLTTPEGLASWFGTRAQIDLRLDGDRIVGWGDDIEMTGRIAAVEPPHRLRIVYTGDGDPVGAEEWLITTEGTTTRLTLVHSMSDDGIDDWDEFYGDIGRGWRLFMASLRHALDGADTPHRHVECRYLPMPGDRRKIWHTVDRRLERAPGIDGLHPELIDPPHSRLLVDRDRTLLIDVEGHGPGQVLYVQASTHGGPGSWRGEVLEALGG